MDKMMRLAGLAVGLLLWAGIAQAVTCTSIASGNWSAKSTWGTAAAGCVGAPGGIPGANDTVIIASPNTVILNNNYSAASLTVSAGATLDDNGNNLTVTGNVVNNGTFGLNGGALIMTGANTTISGTGAFDNTDVQIDALGISLPAGSTLGFTSGAQLRVGRNNTATFILNGAITTGTPWTAGDRIMRVYQNSSVTVNGSINAPNAYIRVEQNASVTNNGSVSVQYLRTDAATSVWTQGVNSNLTVSQPAPAGNWNGVLNASANGNTVTYNGTSTVIPPSAAGYWNLAGTIFPGACPVAYTVSGTNPCPVGSGSIISGPSTCSSVAGAGTIAWTPSPTTNVNTNDNVLYATASPSNGQTTQYLNCTGYNFSTVPAGATITGITVYVDRRASRSNRIRDAFVYLIKGGVISTALNGATATAYTTTDVEEAHGGAGNLWGTTWTLADVTAANFGVAFASTYYSTTAGTRTASVDSIRVKVDYQSATLHHVSINAPATAMSLTEVLVPITPHTSTHGTITGAGAISLSTSTGTGDWTIGTGTGTLTPGAANSGLAIYTFGAGETSASLGFTSQAAGAVTLKVADAGGADMLLNTPAGEKANTIIFSAASYVFTNGACTHNVAFGTAGQCTLVNWSPRTSGQPLANVYITSVNATGVPTRLHPTQVRTRNMQFALSCHDPVANAGVQATFDATITALPLCQANGATPTTWTTAVTLSFAGGSPSVGPYSFNYNDVGKVELWMRNSAATAEIGSSGGFVVKPSGFTLSNIKRTSDGAVNPGAVDAGGTAFVKAGQAFTVSVTAVNAGGTATPNYGKEVSPESVKLAPALVAGLGLTNNPAVTGSFGAFASGTATGAAFAWDEVGVITLTPSVGDADYLGTGDVTGTASGNVGRFSLGKFALQNVTFDERADLCQGGFLVSDGVTACASTFTYMGEEIDANFTLAPKSLSGAAVQNYRDSATAANDFAKLDPTTFASLNLAAVDRTTAGGPYYLTARISNAAMPVASCSTVPCFQSGSADVTAPFNLSRGAAADGRYGAVQLGIALTDSDGARVEGPGATPGLCNNPNAVDCYDLDSDATAGNDRALLAATEFRYGRARVGNAYGSELLTLRVPITAEYWSVTGSKYVTSADDSLSVVALALNNYLGNLNAGETALTVPVIANGVGQIGLSAPGASNNGSVDVTVTAPNYLPGIAGRATFGVYRGNDTHIYMRENY